jgi:hypothetical protein
MQTSICIRETCRHSLLIPQPAAIPPRPPLPRLLLGLSLAPLLSILV